MFDTKISKSVFGLVSPRSDVLQVDCSELQVDIEKAMKDLGGWKGYMIMIKQHVEKEARDKMAKKKLLAKL